ncbi:MAG: aminotransferase class I/II-fold pyridoxal phosphate-dependent enzyme [Parasporobacterium sp.]|nr:aminotransferase class I/II-fold pyridoxal phosphate-dependent enzyme [Parasporobacterium sp.]
MKDPVSRVARTMQPSGIRKFFDVVAEMPDAISLGVGEPDFDTPWHIREAGIYSLEQGRTFYTSNAGLPELKQEVSNYYRRKHGLTYDPKTETFITVGGSEAIDMAMRAMLDPGDQIIIPEPCYVSYVPCARMTGAEVVTIPLQEKNEFKLTAEELLSAVTEKTKLLVLAFPNNPTGAVMTREDLEPIAKICMEKDIYVLSDEIYAELTYSGEHVTIAQLPGMRERTVIINGFSKAYAMTGWRLGFAAGPKEILLQMVKLHQFAIMCAPTTSQYAGLEALRFGDKDIEIMRESYNQRRRYVVNELNDMGLHCFEPFGAFYVFPSIQSLQMSSDEFAEQLLAEEKLAVVPGTAFGSCGEGFIRISYAYSLAELKEALTRIRHFIERRRQG